MIATFAPTDVDEIETAKDVKMHISLPDAFQFFVKAAVLAGLVSPRPKDSSNLFTIVPKVAKKLEQRYSLPCRM